MPTPAAVCLCAPVHTRVHPCYLCTCALFACTCRTGPASGDHVDILGNEAMLMDVLVVAAGRGHELSDKFHSEIQTIMARIDLPAA